MTILYNIKEKLDSVPSISAYIESHFSAIIQLRKKIYDLLLMYHDKPTDKQVL